MSDGLLGGIVSGLSLAQKIAFQQQEFELRRQQTEFDQDIQEQQLILMQEQAERAAVESERQGKFQAAQTAQLLDTVQRSQRQQQIEEEAGQAVRGAVTKPGEAPITQQPPQETFGQIQGAFSEGLFSGFGQAIDLLGRGPDVARTFGTPQELGAAVVGTGVTGQALTEALGIAAQQAELFVEEDPLDLAKEAEAFGRLGQDLPPDLAEFIGAFETGKTARDLAIAVGKAELEKLEAEAEATLALAVARRRPKGTGKASDADLEALLKSLQATK